MFGYDAGKLPEKITQKFTKLLQGFLSFPLNVPGTKFHKCLKVIKQFLTPELAEIIDLHLNF